MLLWGFLLLVLGNAGLFLLLGATFQGAGQILLYAGGLIVLFLFAAYLPKSALVRGKSIKDEEPHQYNRYPALLVVVAFVALGFWYIAEASPWFTATFNTKEVVTVADAKLLGNALLGKHALAFEMGGLLLTFVLAGALYLATLPENKKA
jgi:NADH-quinone oxidoreductase subunit J